MLQLLFESVQSEHGMGAYGKQLETMTQNSPNHSQSTCCWSSSIKYLVSLVTKPCSRFPCIINMGPVKAGMVHLLVKAG